MDLAPRAGGAILICLALACTEPSTAQPPSPSADPSPTSSPASPVAEPPPSPPVFEATTRPLTEAEGEAMRGVSWHPGCPLPLEALARLEISHWGFDGEVHPGVLVIDAEQAEKLTGVFRALFETRFPIRKMQPIEAYAGDDDASMADDNTSAFNCRLVAGKKTVSQHAWGRAIDLNPRENPFVRGKEVQPPEGAAHLDREAESPGLVKDGGPAVEAFEAAGWKWGGRWRRSKDYQHFSLTGR